MGVAAAKPVKFRVVGLAGFLVNLGVFALFSGAHMAYVPASILSYFVSNALMYLGNRYFTFGLGHDGFWSAYLRYCLVGGVVAGLNAAILVLIVKLLHLDPRIGQALSLLLVTPVGFVLFKRWTFRITS